jgi:RNA polymerase nonessential primary-like sigma factor
MNQSREVRLPIHVTKNLSAVLRSFRQLTQTIQGKPRAEEVAQAMGKSVAYVKDCLQQDRHVVSLDAPSLTDTEPSSLEVSIEERDLKRQIRQSLLCLDVRHRTVLIRRFGLDGQEAESLTAIGKELGVTRERVRQLQNEALNLLRRHKELQ